MRNFCVKILVIYAEFIFTSFLLDWASEDRVAVAVYMEGIVTFINLRSNQLVKGVKSLPDFLPLSIKNKIFETFTDDSWVQLVDFVWFHVKIFNIFFSRRVTPESKDRATCYIMVLGLIINNYSLDFSIISNSLKFIKMQAYVLYNYNTKYY